MATSKTCKAFIFVLVVALLAGGGILAWQLLAKDNGDDKGGLFGTGLFSDKNDTISPTTLAPATLSPAPSSAPSVMPTVYRYPYNQCPPNATTSCCNGLENLCAWPVNEILFAGAHNAMATEDKFLVPNHLRPVDEALQAGFRAINVDVCLCQGVWELCHGFCGLGSADPFDVFAKVATFLQENENEVVIVTLQLNSNAGQPVNLNNFYQEVWTQIDGFTDLLYIHNSTEDPWPTLGELMDPSFNKRLLAFHFNGPDCTEEGDCPDGMHHYFQYVQETNFDFPSIQEILDSDLSCQATRGGTTPTTAWFAVNNFVTANTLDLDGQLLAADTANSLDFANQRIQRCAQVEQAGPYLGKGEVNLLYVDFWSVGDIVQVVQEYNRELGEYQ